MLQSGRCYMQCIWFSDTFLAFGFKYAGLGLSIIYLGVCETVMTDIPEKSKRGWSSLLAAITLTDRTNRKDSKDEAQERDEAVTGAFFGARIICVNRGGGRG
jgi:hypothetical protein